MYHILMNLSQFTWNLVPFLSVLVVIGQIISAVILAAVVVEFFTKKTNRMSTWTSQNGLILVLIVTLVSIAGSLYFSEISGWNPCKYCWIQRIFMYPQAILLMIALWKRDRNVARYILALSLIGAGYAAWHYYIQMYNIIAAPTNPATPCDASGESCVKTPFVMFGYITVPGMALTAFLMNTLGAAMVLKTKK